MLRYFLLLFGWLSISIANSGVLAQVPPGVVDTQPKGDTPLSPQESVAKITVPDGFRVTLFAGEPDVHQPIDLTFDDRGRLWVVENFSYPDWDGQARDRILIFEDKDNDGHFDSRKVFAEKLRNITGIALGFGGVWACSTPELIFIPDRDKNDEPDGPAIVKLDGWNDLSDEVEHNVFNGIVWGPDGWMYGGHGILADSMIGKPGDPEAKRQRMNCGIWRYHPITETFEVVAHGTTNPWGLDFDEMGECFFTNSVIGHLWHLIPGARYERMYGTHFDPYAYALIDQCADHYHWGGGRWQESRGGKGVHNDAGGGHAHVGAMIYRGGTWPDEYRGSLLTANLHGNRLNRDTIERHRSGYIAKHAADFLRGNDPWFRGIDLLYGPDGNVFVSDWTDLGECHDSDGTHRSSGRIYKVVYGNRQTLPTFDLSKRSNIELVTLADNKNAWYWTHARRLLHERTAAGQNMSDAVTTAKKRYTQKDFATRRKLQMLDALALTNGVNPEFVKDLLNNDDEVVQCWAVRYLSNHGELTPRTIESLNRIAGAASPKLQLAIASAMRNIPINANAEAYRALATKLMSRIPIDDPNLTSMVWSIIEPLHKLGARRFMNLASVDQQPPNLRRYIVRRAISHDPNNKAQLDRAIDVAKSLRESSKMANVLNGMRDALRGERKVPQPTQWAAFRASVARRYKDPDNLLDELSIKFHDATAIRRLRTAAANTKLTHSERNVAISILAENRVAGTLDLLLGLLDQRPVRKTVIRSLSEFNKPSVATALISRLNQFDAGEREAAVSTLTSSRTHASALLQAVAKGDIASTSIKPTQALAIYQLRDNRLREQLKQHWGDIRSSSGEKRQKIADWKAVLRPKVLAQADLRNGAKVFAENCGKCHKLFGEGGDIGPELTGSDRRNLDYILQNVITPSAAVSKDFRMQTVLLKDGRFVSGALRDQTRSSIVVQTAEKKITIPRDDIDAIEASNLSLMPESQFDALTQEAVRDLVGYLRSNAE